jgi:pimeloyl-ACP methyl ester carboxylesterase
VAEHLTAERANLVRAAALLGCAGGPTAYARLVIEAELEMASQGIEPPQRKNVADLLGVLFTPAQLQVDALVEAWTTRLLARPPWRNPGCHGQCAADNGWNEGYEAMHAARWAKLSVPLLAVAFEYDAGFPPSSVRQLTQAIPGAELAVIPGAGHGGALTHPGEVGEVLLKFFTLAG